MILCVLNSHCNPKLSMFFLQITPHCLFLIYNTFYMFFI